MVPSYYIITYLITPILYIICGFEEVVCSKEISLYQNYCSFGEIVVAG